MAKKSFLTGALMLMIAGLIVRVIGFYYRIYLSNLIGAEGMGLFSLISPVYSLVITTLTAGMSIAIPRLIAAEYARKHRINPPRITRVAFVMLIAAGIAVSVLMYFNLDFIANTIIKDNRTYSSLLFLLPCIPVIAAGTAIKGYFYGIQDMVPSSVSMVVEQLVRIGIVIASASYFARLGLEYACALAVIGMAFGEIANFLVVLIIYKSKKSERRGLPKTGLMRKRTIAKELVKNSVPITANRFITSAVLAAENILIPRMLLLSGLDYKLSIETYGMLMGMAMPILFFPSIITSSMAITLVPAITEATSLKNYKLANSRISKSLQLTVVVGYIFAALFYIYPDKLSGLIYKSADIGGLLKIMSFTCVFMYMQQTLTGILNGLGKQGASFRNSLIGKIVRIGFIVFLIPELGIDAYIYGMIASSVITTGLDILVVVKVTGMAIDIRSWLLKPGAVGFLMYLVSKYMIYFFGIFIKSYNLLVVVSILGTILMGGALMAVMGVLDIKGLFGNGTKKSKFA